MTEFYSPATKAITLPNGRPFQLRKGIHALPDVLAMHADANKLGVKPVEEMTDAEWAALGLNKAKWMAANRPAPSAEPAAAEPVPAAPIAQAAADAPKSADAPSAPVSAPKAS